MRVFLKKIGFICVAVVVLSSVIAFFSLQSLKASSFYKPSFLANQVSEHQFDYIVLGASTGLTTLNTKLIDSIAHTNGINLAMDDTALSSQYLMLQHFLAQGKTTKYCILAPSNPSFDSKTMDVSDNDYRFLPFISTSYVSDYYKQFESKRARLLSLSQWFPMLGVTYYNTELFYPSLLGVLQPEKRNRFDDRGNYTYPVIKNSSKIIQSQSNLRVDFTNQYVEKIKRLCEANNIKLICYFSPVKGVTVISENNEYRCINHSNLLTNTMYFYDSIHVNYRGRQISSIKFAEEFSRITNEK